MGSHGKFSDAQGSPRMGPILLHHHLNGTERKRASFPWLDDHNSHKTSFLFLLAQTSNFTETEREGGVESAPSLSSRTNLAASVPARDTPLPDRRWSP